MASVRPSFRVPRLDPLLGKLWDAISLPFLLARCRVNLITYSFRFVALSSLSILVGVFGVLPEFRFGYFHLVPRILIAIGLLIAVRDAGEIWRFYRGVVLQKRTELFDFSESYISDTYSGFQVYSYSPVVFSGSIGDGGAGTVIASDELDSQLADREVNVRWIDRRFRVDSSLGEYAPAILRQINKNRKIFNSRVVRMNTDLIPSQGTKIDEISVSHTGYYDFICSNELFRYRVNERNHTDEKTLGELGLVDYNNQLFDLSGSHLANPIGISILAMTNDGYLILTKQTKHNSVNSDLLVSTGSGSLDHRDIKKMSSKRRISDAPNLRIKLNELIGAGMVRELEEETGIPIARCSPVRLVGYSRWLDRGAKPEFYGFTTLTLNREEALACKIKGFERVYSASKEAVRADYLNWEEIADLKLDSLGSDLAKMVGLPLAFNLRAIAKQIVNSTLVLPTIRQTA